LCTVVSSDFVGIVEICHLAQLLLLLLLLLLLMMMMMMMMMSYQPRDVEDS